MSYLCSSNVYERIEFLFCHRLQNIILQFHSHERYHLAITTDFVKPETIEIETYLYKAISDAIRQQDKCSTFGQ